MIMPITHSQCDMKSLVYGIGNEIEIPTEQTRLHGQKKSRTSSLRSLLRMLAWRNERLSKDPFEGRFWLVDLDTMQMTGTKSDTQYGGQNAEKNCLPA